MRYLKKRYFLITHSSEKFYLLQLHTYATTQENRFLLKQNLFLSEKNHIRTTKD